MVHEMLHTLGVYHQHNRPHRETYVRIHTENIGSTPGTLENFKIRPEANIFETAYDYRSVMHYGKTVSILYVNQSQ